MNTDNLFSLNGKTALVTGSSRGLGNVFAQGLAEAGARVVLNGTNKSRLEEAVAAMQQEGHEASGRAFDIGDSKACAENIHAIEAETGPVEVLINNAGIH